MSALTEAAPAKINLYLHVVGRRPDGYHLLDSLVVFAAIGDRLSVSPSATLSLTITGPHAAALTAEPDNLVLRAARRLAAQAGVPATGALHLEKNLPVASGIGGGSADAAATLRLLSRFWGIPPASLPPLAEALGADVPVCLAGKPALMAGIGDILLPAPEPPRLGIVLVNPGVAVATRSVFQSRTEPFSNPPTQPIRNWHDAAALVATLEATRNDLEPAARRLAPVIGDAMDWLAGTPACLFARMSGSGATCFGLYPGPEHAIAAARTSIPPGWWAWGGPLAP